jgi:hypothetical protein
MASAFASFAKGHALDYSVRAQSQDTYEIADFTFAEGFGPDMKLTRTPSCRARATAIFAIGGRKTDSRIGVRLATEFAAPASDRYWHEAAYPGCPRLRRVLEDERTRDGAGIRHSLRAGL